MGCAGSSQSKPDGEPPLLFNPLKTSSLHSLFVKSLPISSWVAVKIPSFFFLFHGIREQAWAVKKIRKPKPWKHPQPITKTQLTQLRDEFWDTAPHYGGRKEIWDALRAAAEADLTLAQAIVDSAGVIVQSSDLTVCYDERGAKYELPKYVLSEPTNLIRDT
ncbi:Ubiquitin domain-containing protein 2 [Glycine soja]